MRWSIGPVVLLGALLAGCTAGANGPQDYFPTPPDGWSYTTGPEEAPLQEEIRDDMEDFGLLPERMLAASLAGPGGTALLQVFWSDTPRPGQADAVARIGCDGDDVFHLLADDHAIVMVGSPGADEPEAATAAALDALRDRIHADTGARIAC